MLTFELNLGPLRLYFSLGDAPSEPATEYVPAAQVERADTYVPEPRGEPIEDRRIGFRA